MTQPTESQSIAALEHITVRSVEQLVETRTKLAEVEADRDRLADALAQARRDVDASDEAARRCLDQRQEMAAERYEWQERGLRAEAERDQLAAAVQRTIRLLDNSGEPIHPATLAAALTGNYCDCGGPHQPTECGGDTEPFLPDPAAVRAALGSPAPAWQPCGCPNFCADRDCYPPASAPNRPAAATCPTCGGDGIHQIGCTT